MHGGAVDTPGRRLSAQGALMLPKRLRLVASELLSSGAETETHWVCYQVGQPEWDWWRIDWLRRLRPELRSSEVRRQAFREGSRLAAELQHPGIVTTLAAEDLEDGEPIGLLESVRGHTLATLLERQGMTGDPIPRRCAARIFDEVARALDYARARGACHDGLAARDVWVGSDGRVLVGAIDQWRRVGDAGEDEPALRQLREELQLAGDRAPKVAKDGEVEEWVTRIGEPTTPSAEFAARCRTTCREAVTTGLVGSKLHRNHR